MFAAPKPRRNTQRQHHAPLNPQPPPAQPSGVKLPEDLDALILPDFSPDSNMGILLRSHISPTDSERAQFQALRENCLRQAASFDSLSVNVDHKVSELEAEIAKLRLRATSLREKSKEAHLTHCRLQALLAPSRVLPPEIMSEIFLACLGATVFARTDEAPLLLCRVCSSWRSIALSTPQLWAALTITDSNFRTIGSASTEWFSRSGNLPLSLQFHLPSFSSTDPFVPPSQCSRLRNLEVNLQSGYGTAALLNVFSDAGLSSLERLSISDSNTQFLFYTSELPVMPNLRRLLVSSMVWSHGTFSHSPWKHLTHISTTGYKLPPVSWRSLIRECTSLQHGSFTLGMALSSEENAGINTMIALPHLVSLKIVFVSKGRWSILSGLSFPSLLSLTLGTSHPHYRYRLDSLSEGMSLWHAPTFAQINVHSLETLVLFNVSVRKESLIAFLRTTPKLKSFTGDFPFDYGPLFAELSLFPDEAGDGENIPRVMSFLPNLSKLLIYPSPSGRARTRERKVHFDVGLLTQMVRMRWRSPRQSSDEANPPLEGGLTNVFVGLLQEGTLLKAQITTALRPFSRLGLIVGAEVEPNGYQIDLNVDW